MPNIFRFEGSNNIEALGTIELGINSWDYTDPIDIILNEIDIQSFNRRRSLSGTPQSGSGGWTYIGKIACQIREVEDNGYYFELAERPLGLAQERDAPRLPIPFKLKIPTIVNGDQQGFHEFYFYLTGEMEDRYEVSVKINQQGRNIKLAPVPPPDSADEEDEEEEELFMVAGIRGIGRITMPRFLQIVQPYFINNLNPETHQQIPAGDDRFRQMAQNCVAYIIGGPENITVGGPENITGRLRNINQVIDDLFDHEKYRSAARGEESWVRNVVENMTGLPHKIGQSAYGGGSEGWRHRLKQRGEYPACNVCDQLGSVIQWARGLPSEDVDAYVDGGLQQHKQLYQNRWADNTWQRGGAVYCDDFSTANTPENRRRWAKPGASIFFYKLKWIDNCWQVKHGPRRNDYRPAQTDSIGIITNSRFVGHESTIIRTRGSGGDVEEVQLFDYGLNLQGGRGRGSVGRLEHVAQESGWIPITNALTFLDQCVRPDIPASPKKFFSVGWRPRDSDDTQTLIRPLGNITLTISQKIAGTVLQSRTRAQIEGRGSEDPNVIKPITKYIAALSGMPHADQLKATFKIESTPSFSGAPSPVHLLDIETDQYGRVNVISRVPRS